MSDPLTLRYNNPGAVEFKPWMAQHGAKLGPGGRYAQFDTPEQGYGVMSKILDTYQNKHGLNTVGGIVNRWAPSNVDNNSTGTYISSVASRLGVKPDQPLGPEHRQPLMQAMAHYEAGRAPAPIGSAPTGSQPMYGMIARPQQTMQPQQPVSMPQADMGGISPEHAKMLADMGLMTSNSRTPQNFGEGLADIGNKLNQAAWRGVVLQGMQDQKAQENAAWAGYGQANAPRGMIGQPLSLIHI